MDMEREIKDVLFAIGISFIWKEKLYTFCPITIFKKLSDNCAIFYTIKSKA